MFPVDNLHNSTVKSRKSSLLHTKLSSPTQVGQILAKSAEQFSESVLSLAVVALLDPRSSTMSGANNAVFGKLVSTSFGGDPLKCPVASFEKAMEVNMRSGPRCNATEVRQQYEETNVTGEFVVLLIDPRRTLTCQESHRLSVANRLRKNIMFNSVQTGRPPSPARPLLTAPRAVIPFHAHKLRPRPARTR